MQAAVAAGHPATVGAGIEILDEGGSAADAAVAAALASCVAETVMTGLLGGGHAIHYESASGRVRNLDCFVAVPGLGAERREPALVHLDVPFGAELVHYAVGPASCAVPGLPAGLEALWLWQNAVGVQGVRALADSPYLESLHSLSLGGNRLGGEAVEVILQGGRFEQLEELHLPLTGLDDAQKAALRERFGERVRL